jgi:GntR family transcriptional regulator/MocR family aminotransferase
MSATVVDRLARTAAKAVVVTPAHQYPTGAAMTPDRRAALLAWAAKRDAWIIEDDYDAEFRYDRGPLGALQGLAPDRVVYVGTGSKILSPALRPIENTLPVAKRCDLELARSGHEHLLGRDRGARRHRSFWRNGSASAQGAPSVSAPPRPADGGPRGTCRTCRSAACGRLAPDAAPPAGTDESTVVAAAASARSMCSGCAIGASRETPAIVIGYGCVSEPDPRRRPVLAGIQRRIADLSTDSRRPSSTWARRRSSRAAKGTAGRCCCRDIGNAMRCGISGADFTGGSRAAAQAMTWAASARG